MCIVLAKAKNDWQTCWDTSPRDIFPLGSEWEWYIYRKWVTFMVNVGNSLILPFPWILCVFSHAVFRSKYFRILFGKCQVERNHFFPKTLSPYLRWCEFWMAMFYTQWRVVTCVFFVERCAKKNSDASCEMSKILTSHTILTGQTGGFKYFLFSPLLGEDFQFD